MGRALPWLATPALALMLGACGAPPYWTKDGVTSEVASADYSDCRAAAQHDIQRDVDIDTDIAASRDRDWSQSQTTKTHLAEDASANRKLSGDMVRNCMEAKGYAPAGPEPTNGPHWWQIFAM